MRFLRSGLGPASQLLVQLADALVQLLDADFRVAHLPVLLDAGGLELVSELCGGRAGGCQFLPHGRNLALELGVDLVLLEGALPPPLLLLLVKALDLHELDNARKVGGRWCHGALPLRLFDFREELAQLQ